METMTDKDYLNSDEVSEHSKRLQREAQSDTENTVYLTHQLKLELIQKLGIKTADKCWTAEDKEKISAMSKKFVRDFEDFLKSELQNNPDLAVLELKFQTLDYKVAAELDEAKSVLRAMLELEK